MLRWNATPWASALQSLALDMIPDLVTVGGLTVDNVVAADGTVGLAKAGGNGAYSAVGALMWRPAVGLVSAAVASYPRETIRRLESGGLDLGGVVWRDEELTSSNWFIYDAEGRREEGLSSPPGALAEAGFPTDRLSPSQTSQWREILRARSTTNEISYSEFRNRHPLSQRQIPPAWKDTRAVLLAPSQPDVMHEMLDFFKPGGAVVIADPGWQLAEHKLDQLAPLLSKLDAFLPSEVELRALVPGADLEHALRVLSDYCPGALAVKLGAKGSLVWNRVTDTPASVPAEATETVDPTGAGDSFCGGFLVGLLETGDAVQAARFGSMSASRIVAHFGADGALLAHPDGASALSQKAAMECR